MKELFKAFIPGKTSIRNKGSWLFYVLTVFILGSFILILSSRFFTEDPVTNVHTPIKKWQNTSTSGSVRINQWTWNKEKQTMDFVIEYKQELDKDVIQNVQYKIIPNATPDVESKYKIINQMDNKQAIRVYDVKPNFEVLVVKILSKDKESDNEEEILKVFGNEKNVSIEQKKTLPTKEDYQLSFIKDDIEINKQNLKNKEKEKVELKKNIEDLNTEINLLDAKKTYQISDEKEETNNQIEAKKSEIKEKENEINNVEEAEKKLQEKIDLLNKKYQATNKIS
ncbi:coiled-coil domain-containing protein [Staphylococcus aureus]|uniref:coiled-coil domain-containing protein n=1 Tax=Staphylococcus aureus TaxID=1280 RepID=UPI0038921B20